MHIHAHTWTYMHARKHSQLHTYASLNACTHTCTDILKRTHMCTHTNTNTCPDRQAETEGRTDRPTVRIYIRESTICTQVDTWIVHRDTYWFEHANIHKDGFYDESGTIKQKCLQAWKPHDVMYVLVSSISIAHTHTYIHTDHLWVTALSDV